MLIRLLSNKRMYKLTLPDEVHGDYWISDESVDPSRKLINVRGINNQWIISSNYNVQIGMYETGESGKLEYTALNNAALKEYSLYFLKYNNNETYYLISEPINSGNLYHYKLKGIESFTIGRSQKNEIVYSNSQIENEQVSFENKSGWYVKNLHPEIPIFIDGDLLTEAERKLTNGSTIYILGLKLILIGNELFFNKTNYAVVINSPKLIIDNSKSLPRVQMEDDDDSDLYKNSDYFVKIPRISNIIEETNIKIDEPPKKQDDNSQPMWLMLGSSMTMGIMMLISTMVSINQSKNNQDSRVSTYLAIGFAVIMLLSMVLFPILNYRFDDIRKEKAEKKRQQKYQRYLNKKYKQIDATLTKQRGILFQNYLNNEQCSQVVLRKTNRLWERSSEDEDFMTVRIGRGEVKSKIKLTYSEEHFSLEDDDLLESLHKVEAKSGVIKDAPITLNLNESNITAIIDENAEDRMNFIKSIILQLVTFQSYDDLKIVLFVEDNNNEQWNFLKMLPHNWNNSKTIRYFGNDYEEIKELESELILEYKERLNQNEFNGDNSKSLYQPYYLIITDNYLGIQDLPLIENIVNNKANVGFGLLTLSDQFNNLPEKAKNFINIQEEKGILFEHKLSSESQQYFMVEDNKIQDVDRIIYQLANLPIKLKKSTDAILPNMLTYLQMYNIGRIEQLNILDNWRDSNSVVSLKALIGKDSTSRPIYLDIHEKAQGTHGLVAGSTGSGKSEFLITYILSMAINYSPEDVNFVIIDYKGSGLSSAFDRADMKLPHLVGTITNISTSELERSLLSFQSELKRREKIFNETVNTVNEGTMDIYKYQRLYHEGLVEEALPHLIIVCDEFAELKQQQPDFMEQLVSISRVGRSLGVHLILSTQKPQGVVDDQIRSNCNFRICLKVQDKMDSMDVIETTDAVKLQQAGQFYMRANNGEPILGQSGYAGAKYLPQDISKKKVDKTLKYISNTGKIYKEVTDHVEEAKQPQGEQLTSIVKYIVEMSESKGYKTRQLWLNNIPEDIYVDNIKKKYSIKPIENEIKPIIGEYDDPYNQTQGVVQLDLTNKGNVLIYGSGDSGRETLLDSMIYSIITNHYTEECELYIMDFGSESLKIFKGSPQVGDVVFLLEEEKIQRLLDMLEREIKRRTKILSDYNGNFKIYQKLKKQPMPLIVLVLNNFSSFVETYPEMYDDILNKITREGNKCGIVTVMTVSSCSDVRYRLTQNFPEKVALKLNNTDDYSTIFNISRHRKLDNIFGRGFIKLNDIYEFQTAKITTPDNFNNYIKTTIDSLNSKVKFKTVEVPTLPEVVTINDVKSAIDSYEKLPIGIEKDSLNIYQYDFSYKLITLLMSRNRELTRTFGQRLFELIKTMKNVSTISCDEDSEETDDNYQDFDSFIAKLEEEIDDPDVDYVYALIINLDKMSSNDSSIASQLDEILEKAKESGKCSIIISDDPSRFKGHEYESWYKNYVDVDSGIWLGNGIKEQYLFNVDFSTGSEDNKCGNDSAIAIARSKTTIIKALGMKG